MAWKGRDKNIQVDFAQLLTILNNSKLQISSPPTYQVIKQLLENAQKNKNITVTEIEDILNQLTDLSTTIVDLSDIFKNATFITTGNETLNLPQSVQLLAGTGITFDDTVPNKRTINSSGGGSSSSALGFIGTLEGRDGEDSYIPGPPGLQGAIGNTGNPGINGIGIPGEDGRDGEDSYIPGPAGIQGAIGATGSAGSPGINGINGLDGIDGNDGIDSIIPGPVGPVGPQGIQGNPGLVGYNGLDGIDGQDGLDSLIPGPIGPAGSIGNPGSAGPSGYNGIDGVDGQDGIDGLIPGPIGTPGTAGINGLDGSQPTELLALIGKALKRIWFLEQALEVDYRSDELTGSTVPTDAELIALEEIDLLEDVVNVTYNQRLRTFGITIDGGGSVISTGTKGEVQVPYSGTIIGWTLLATDGLIGSIVVDVYKDTYANFPPTVADTITGSSKPTISSSNKGTGISPDWITTINAGDIFAFNVDSITTLTRVTLTVTVLIF